MLELKRAADTGHGKESGQCRIKYTFWYKAGKTHSKIFKSLNFFISYRNGWDQGNKR